MSYNKEKELYPEIVDWLKSFLEDRFSKWDVSIFDTHREYLNSFLSRKNFNIKEAGTYQIKVDVTGILQKNGETKLVFVETKNTSITLKDISQILGYSKVANPVYSFLISPEGVSKPVQNLFEVYDRYDILKYSSDGKIRIYQWKEASKEPDFSSVIPPGNHI